MPLKNRDAQQSSLLSNPPNLTQERDHGRDDPTRSVTPSQSLNGVRMTRSTSTVSNDSRASNPLGARDVVDFEAKLRQKAMSLKLNVPHPFESRTTAAGSKAVDSTSSQEGTKWSTANSRELRNHAPTLSAFDNTESIHWDDDSEVQEIENQTIVFRGNRDQAARAGAKVRDGPSLRNSRGLENTSGVQPAAVHFGNGFEDEIAQGRQIFEQKSLQMAGGTSRPMEPTSDSVISDTNVNEPIAAIQPHMETPSRAATLSLGRKTRAIAPPYKTVSFDSPAIRSRELAKADSPILGLIPQTNNNSLREILRPSSSIVRVQDVGSQKTRGGDAALPLQAQEQRQEKITLEHRSISAFDSSREPDYPTSEEEFLSNNSRPSSPSLDTSPSKQKSRKRPREDDLDFEIGMLKTMPYKDLMEQSFDADPRDITPHDEFDGHGNTKSLSQRLSNLSRMSEEEQRSMFQRQSDDEWTLVGSWFIDKFQEDLRRLMENKLEKRKTSMRFENEIRRRQTGVEWSLVRVEQDLKSLKEGGGELIKGRDAASRRGTPQKRT